MMLTVTQQYLLSGLDVREEMIFILRKILCGSWLASLHCSSVL